MSLLPEGWEEHVHGGDTFFTSPDGESVWEIPTRAYLEPLEACFPNEIALPNEMTYNPLNHGVPLITPHGVLVPPDPIDHGAALSDIVVNFVERMQDKPFLRECITKVGRVAEEELFDEAMASTKLLIVRAVCRVMKNMPWYAVQEVERLIRREREERPARGRCPVCLELVLITTCETLPNCGDLLCRPCLQDSLEWQLSVQPRTTRFSCPLGPNCTRPGPADGRPFLGYTMDLMSSIMEQGSDSLKRRWHLANNLNIIPCPAPHCNAGFARRPTLDEGWLTHCNVCETNFCGLHGLRHTIDIENPIRVCAAHSVLEATPGSSDPRALLDTKPCPGCLTQIFRVSGCDHMRCTVCLTNWCWSCGNRTGDYAQAHICIPPLHPRHRTCFSVCVRFVVIVYTFMRLLLIRGLPRGLSWLLFLPFLMLYLALVAILFITQTPVAFLTRRQERWGRLKYDVMKKSVIIVAVFAELVSIVLNIVTLGGVRINFFSDWIMGLFSRLPMVLTPPGLVLIERLEFSPFFHRGGPMLL